MKRNTVTKLANEYAIRRLVRRGCLAMSDIVRAVGCSKVAAIAVMKDLESRYPDVIVRNGPRLFVTSPPQSWLDVVTDEQLMEAIRNGGDEIETGLITKASSGKKVELPIKIHTWSSGEPPAGVMTQIAKCLMQRDPLDHRSSMEIKYVSMKRGESAKWRRIVPIGLERVLDQWRLIAQDMASPNHPVKTYVLTRIMESRPSVEPLPPKFKLKLFGNIQFMSDITLNRELTTDQENVIRKELSINKETGQVQLETRTGFEFLRRFGSIPPSDDAVWPIVTSVGDKKCM